jgi:flagellar basal body-associated protein FliL
MENMKKKIIKTVLIVFVAVILLVGGGILYIMKTTGINRLPDKVEFFTDDEMKKMEEENQDGDNEVIINE